MRYYIIFLVAFFFSHILRAQQHITVGDDAPQLHAFRWIKGDSISALKTDKVYLIEFGATWCTPCAKAIPELSRMADAYKGNVTVISVFVMEPHDPKSKGEPAYVNRVQNYIRKRGNHVRYSVALDDPQQTVQKSWLRNAGRDGIPQIFVVDAQRKIAGITPSPAEAEKILNEVLAPNYDVTRLAAAKKVAEASITKYDKKKLLLLDGNGGDEHNFFFRSILTAYDGNFRAANAPFIESNRFGPTDTLYNYLKDRVQVIGVSIDALYYIAYGDTLTKMPYTRNYRGAFQDTIARPHRKSVYGKEWHFPVLEVKDKTPFQVEKKQIENRFNYSLKVPDGAGTAAFLQRCMRHDLNKYFGYHAKIQKREMPVWWVKMADKSKLLNIVSSDQTKFYTCTQQGDVLFFQHADMRDVIAMLGSNFGYPPLSYGKLKPEDEAAFLDVTGFEQKINFMYDKHWTFDQTIVYLNSIGLAIEKGRKEMNVVVISD